MAAIVLLALLTSATASCGDDFAPLVAAAGYQVQLGHSEKKVAAATGPQISWRTTWRLTWQPVAGAARYAVHYGTSEGKPNGPPDRIEPGPELSIEAAAGTSPAERLDQDRAAALAMTAAQLMVAVAPLAADGTEGPRSSWFPVGDVPPSGVPIGAEPSGPER